MPAPPFSSVEIPTSDALMDREVLACLEAHDAIATTEYSFVAYKETHRASGSWCVRIDAHPTGGALFHPNAIRIQARAASAKGRSWFTWGKPVTPTLDDARKVEFRVHVRDGYAAGIEIYARLRRFDGNLDEPRTAFFSWPAD